VTGEYRQRTLPVDALKPNPWGLFQVHGNVEDWVEDCWHDDYRGAPADAFAWTQGGNCSRRMLRGGSWHKKPGALRSANRNWATSSVRDADLGFRVGRTLTP
jgi:formylglycine-generating enzyme required for sulfatase activity